MEFPENTPDGNLMQSYYNRVRNARIRELLRLLIFQGSKRNVFKEKFNGMLRKYKIKGQCKASARKKCFK